MKETQTRHNKKTFTEYIPQTCPAFWIFACPRIAHLFRSAERGQGRGASSWPATQLELPGMILRSHPTKLKHWTPLERVQQALRTNKHTTQMHAHPIRDPYEPRTGAGSESITGHTQLCGCPAQSHQSNGPNTWPVLRCWAACTIWAQKLSYFVLAAFFPPPLMIMTTCPRFCGYEKNHISCMSKHNHNALGRRLARGEIFLNLPTIEYFMVS